MDWLWENSEWLIVTVVIAGILAVVLAASLGPAERFTVVDSRGRGYLTNGVDRLPDGGLRFLSHGNVIEVHGPFRLVDRGARPAEAQ